MVYWIRREDNGRCISGTSSYDEALKMQDMIWEECKVGTFIDK